jgi:hypothetical protein
MCLINKDIVPSSQIHFQGGVLGWREYIYVAMSNGSMAKFSNWPWKPIRRIATGLSKYSEKPTLASAKPNREQIKPTKIAMRTSTRVRKDRITKWNCRWEKLAN